MYKCIFWYLSFSLNTLLSCYFSEYITFFLYVHVKFQEVRELRAKDAKVWTVTALSNMLQVKPLAIL